MRNVAGISQTEAQKSADMFMKCRYLDGETNSKGVVFSTGTPISNSLTEMYTMQRYLQYEKLVEMGLEHFDQWASIFTEPTSEMELAPEGGGYRMRTRCAKFMNLPELMNTFFEVADIKTAESLNLPRPIANFHTISCEPTELQKEMVVALGKRADDVRNRRVKPHIDNMLAITNDGRKLGLDQRVINPLLPDDPNSKLNQAVDNIFNIWDKSKEERLTQVVFSDLATPDKSIWKLSKEQQKEIKTLSVVQKAAFLGKHIIDTAKNLITGNHPGKFNVYYDVKAKLIDRGVPEEEIAFVHDYDSDKQKQQLFAKVRAGTIRVVIGSTEKMGAGTNIQDKLVALHHLDCPWRPRDLTQREGRILRRGNNNKVVDIFRYVTKDTFDAYLYQTIEKKQQFISQIMTDKSPMRTVDDVDQSVLDYAEVKALCVGNPKIKEKMDLEQDLKKLNALQSQYKRNLYRMEDALLKRYPAQITAKEQNIENYIADEKRLAANTVKVTEGISPMVIDNVSYSNRNKAGEAIRSACKDIFEMQDSLLAENRIKGHIIGTYRGFDLHLSYDRVSNLHILTLKGDMPYPIKLQSDFPTQGVVTVIDNLLDKIPQYIESEKEGLQNTKDQMEAAKIEIAKPFPQEAELKEKASRVALLNAELSLEAIKAAEAAEQNTEDDSKEHPEYGKQPENTEHGEPVKQEKPPEHENTDIEHDSDYDIEIDDDIESEEQTSEEIFASVADSFGTDIIHETQINSESIGENFEIADNGGKGAYVNSDIVVNKTTEKASDMAEVPQSPPGQAAKTPHNNVVPLHLQPKLKPSQHIPNQHNQVKNRSHAL